jgi:hypothetical protein
VFFINENLKPFSPHKDIHRGGSEAPGLLGIYRSTLQLRLDF